MSSVWKRVLGIALTAALAAVAAAQTDHDNIDARRPLRFEDAEPIAYRSRAFDYGFGLNFPRRRTVGLDGSIEYFSGIAPNSQLEVGISPLLGGRSDSRSTAGAIGEFDVAYFYSFRQELRNTPALAAKVEASFPGVSGENPVYRLRGIASRTVNRYDRVHLNLDADFEPSGGSDVTKARLGAILGYTHPLGYPREFNTTGLAELAIVPGTRSGEGYGLSLGAGLRRQISPRAVLDFGVQSDVVPGRNTTPNYFRLVAGYSVSF